MIVKVILDKSKVIKDILKGSKRRNFFSFIYDESIYIFFIFYEESIFIEGERGKHTCLEK